MDGTAPAPPLSRTSLGVRARTISPWIWLVCIVGAVAAARWTLALAHSGPTYIPDEYVYAALARALGEHGSATIRGAHAPFPALLQPLLTAPLWRAGSVQTGYALVKALNAVAMASSALPLYLLARRLRLSTGEALLCGLLGALSPNLYFAAFALSNPLSYPLALGAVVAGVAVLEEATARRELLFLGLAGLAAFASIQFVVLPVALVCAALLVERGRLARAARSSRLTLALLGLGLLALLARPGALGIYRHAPGLGGRLGAGDWAHEVTLATFLLALAAGACFAPGALAALVHGLGRSRAREERAFAALFVVLLAWLLVESSPVAFAGGRFEERYLIVIAPLLPVAFLLWRRQGFPHRLVAGAAAGALLVALALLPLSTYTVRYGSSDSPLLSAVSYLEGRLGTGGGALASALVASACSLVALALALRPRERGVRIAVAAGLLWLVGVSGASSTFAIRNAERVRAGQPSDLSWIDGSGARQVVLVSTLGTRPDTAVSTLFWNPQALDREAILGRGSALDQYGAPRLTIASDGRLLDGRQALAAPVLFDESATVVILSGAPKPTRLAGYSLWRPRGAVRLQLLAEGFWRDRRLDRLATVRLWPGRRAGTLRLRFRATPARGEKLRLTAPGLNETLALRPGEARTLTLPVRGSRPFSLRIAALDGVRYDGRRATVGFAAPPIFSRR